MQANHNNSTASIEMIYEKHAAVMYGCIYKLVPQKEFADKILSEVFIDLYKKREEHNYSINDSVWFLKLAIKAAFTFIKQGPLAKDFPAMVTQQILDIKTTKYAQLKYKVNTSSR